jgi:hypothetical protein
MTTDKPPAPMARAELITELAGAGVAYERDNWLGKPCITVRDDALRSRRQVDVVCDLYERGGWSVCHEDEENFLGFVFF